MEEFKQQMKMKVDMEGHEDPIDLSRTSTIFKKEKKFDPFRTKRVQTNRPVEDKIAALDLLRTGKTKAHVSRTLGIAESTIRGWVKEENKLRSQQWELAQRSPNRAENEVSPPNRVAVEPVNNRPSDDEQVPQANAPAPLDERQIEWLEYQRVALQNHIHAMNFLQMAALRHAMYASVNR